MVNVFRNDEGRKLVLESYDNLLKQWGVEYMETDIPTAYGSTHCITAGDRSNPPLLLFHGVGDNSAVMWVLNIKELSTHFYCIAIDTIGGPGKSVPNDNYTKKNFKQYDWINQIVEYFGLKQFNVAGVSNGAVMAFNYTVNHPERVTKAICLEGGMVLSMFKALLSMAVVAFPEALIPTRENMLKIIKKIACPESGFIEKHPEVIDHILLAMKYHKQSAMFVHKHEKYNKEKAAPVRDKYFFLIGGHMLKDRNEMIELLKRDGYKYKIIEKAGHGVNHEQPEVINHEITNYLSSIAR